MLRMPISLTTLQATSFKLVQEVHVISHCAKRAAIIFVADECVCQMTASAHALQKFLNIYVHYILAVFGGGRGTCQIEEDH